MSQQESQETGRDRGPGTDQTEEWEMIQAVRKELKPLHFPRNNKKQ